MATNQRIPPDVFLAAVAESLDLPTAATLLLVGKEWRDAMTDLLEGVGYAWFYREFPFVVYEYEHPPGSGGERRDFADVVTASSLRMPALMRALHGPVPDLLDYLTEAAVGVGPTERAVMADLFAVMAARSRMSARSLN